MYNDSGVFVCVVLWVACVCFAVGTLVEVWRCEHGTYEFSIFAISKMCKFWNTKNRHFDTIGLSGVWYTLPLGIAPRNENVGWDLDRADFEIGRIFKFEFSKMKINLKIGFSKMSIISFEDKKILSLSFSIRLCIGTVWELMEVYTSRQIGSTGQIFNICHFGFWLFWLENFTVFPISLSSGLSLSPDGSVC